MNKMTANRNKIAPIRVGVIGAGNMGQHHLRFYSMLNSAKLVAVVDVDPTRAEAAAAKYHCQAYGQIEDLIGKVDAVSIAVPSNLHASVGEFFLNNQVHCLIEKPLAISENECLKLIKTAESKNVILLVGHVEHFNPAVLTLADILKNAGQIYSLEAKRMGWNSNHRIPGVDVVLDLMVHDLEIVSFLHEQAITNITAQGASFHAGGNMDQVTSLLSFDNGTIANLTASWVAARKFRTLEVNTESGTFYLDYSAQKLLYYRSPAFQTKPGNLSQLDASQHYRCEAQLEQIFVRHQEPLLLELQNFLQSIDAGVALGVNGYQALNALNLAWKIQAELVSTTQHKKVQMGFSERNLKVMESNEKSNDNIHSSDVLMTDVSTDVTE